MTKDSSYLTTDQPVDVAQRRVSRSIKTKFFLNMFNRWFPSLLYKKKLTRWNHTWSNTKKAIDFDAAIPNDLRTALQDGWIKPGSKVLDIGCGGGELSAWLAEQGHTVLGVDYSQAAIEKARSWFGDNNEHLSFDVVDICNETPSIGDFDVLLDKGCFHGIPDKFRKAYVENIVKCSAPTSRLIMFIRLDEVESKIQSLVDQHFSPYFEIVDVSHTDLMRVAGSLTHKILPALTIRMIKKT